MATKSIAWDSGGGYIRLTYTGSGNGTISVESDANTIGSARSKTITIKTTNGGLVTKNVTVSQAACPVPIGTVLNYNYTGSVQSVLLPAGSYKLQCWGAQGGSNAAVSSYGITAKDGGKGGYSEGILTLSSPTTVYIFVGGQGASSGNGGWNGGGGGTGETSFENQSIFGITKMGCGGGATDIALVTSSMSYSSYRNNRSAASLLSRMIVAGGGGGGAMCYKSYTHDISTSYQQSDISPSGWCISGTTYGSWPPNYQAAFIDVSAYRNGNCSITWNGSQPFFYTFVKNYPSYSGQTVSYATGYSGNSSYSGTLNLTIPSDASYLYFYMYDYPTGSIYTPQSVYLSKTVTDYSTNYKVGYVGGGAKGGGYDDNYKGRQNAAGLNGAFGLGANQQSTAARFHGGLGGAGWYGGGSLSDYVYENDYYVTVSGGGSGFVNTYENRNYRPSGYTGLQLDSGETKDGTQTFKSPSGSNETGHSGNGYARITRLS